MAGSTLARTPTTSDATRDVMTAWHAGSMVLRQHGVFFGAVASVMLHIADDNFLQPPDGVSPSDHLVAGLMPLGMVALAAWAYPRVRDGAQAAIAFAVALTGLVTGLTEPVSHLVQGGFRGDDVSGVIAGAAGLLLVVLATRTLWRSRRADGTRTRRYVRRLVIGILGLVVLFELALPFASAYVSTHISRIGVPAPALGAAHEDVTLTTIDGLHLDGWYVPSKNGAAVIVFPGRKTPQDHARMLVRHGYGVLLFDRRGEGQSEGDPNTFGWGGARDIHAAVDYLQHRPDVEPGRIGGLGLSVGGEMMLEAAAENPDLAAVVTEGAGNRSLKERLVHLDGRDLLRGLHQLVVNEVGLSIFSNSQPPPSLVDVVPDIAPRPVFLIWAPDGGTSETMSPLYHRLIGSSATIWSLPEVEHLKGFQTYPEEYERRVVGFFDHALHIGTQQLR
jgi:uncharacterized protein